MTCPFSLADCTLRTCGVGSNLSAWTRRAVSVGKPGQRTRSTGRSDTPMAATSIARTAATVGTPSGLWRTASRSRRSQLKRLVRGVGLSSALRRSRATGKGSGRLCAENATQRNIARGRSALRSQRRSARKRVIAVATHGSVHLDVSRSTQSTKSARSVTRTSRSTSSTLTSSVATARTQCARTASASTPEPERLIRQSRRVIASSEWQVGLACNPATTSECSTTRVGFARSAVHHLLVKTCTSTTATRQAKSEGCSVVLATPPSVCSKTTRRCSQRQSTT